MEAKEGTESQGDQISKTQNKEIKEEEKESQGDQISKTQNKEIKEAGGGVTPEVTVPNLAPRKYKILSPLLPRHIPSPRHIEWRKRLGQNPAFLSSLEGALTNKRKELTTCHQELEEDPKQRRTRTRESNSCIWCGSLRIPSIGSSQAPIT